MDKLHKMCNNFVVGKIKVRERGPWMAGPELEKKKPKGNRAWGAKFVIVQRVHTGDEERDNRTNRRSYKPTGDGERPKGCHIRR